MKKLCFAVMAMCMLLSCGGKNEKGAATEEATLSGLMKSDFVSEVDGKPTALSAAVRQRFACGKKAIQPKMSRKA